jgi:hypothetical protein
LSVRRTKDLPLIIGRIEDRGLATARAVPVTILSMSTRKGAPYDFDATAVDAATIRIGPNRAPLLGGSDEQGWASPQLRDADDDGIMDFVGCFSPDQAGVNPETTQVCAKGRTREGETFKGCGDVTINEGR